MNQLDEFIKIITGSFNNESQFNTLKQQGIKEYPYAEHIMTVCNNRINHLPTDFKAYFVLEESYYTLNNHKNAQPRLFLFSQKGTDVLLTSIDLPSNVPKEQLTSQKMPILDYSSLVPSSKFTPALFVEKDGEWRGGSESMFTPTLKFTLKEIFSSEKLIVSEVMENNGKKTFGFEPPIEYKRVLKK